VALIAFCFYCRPSLTLSSVCCRVAISEEFGEEPGAYSPGQLVAGLKKLGFDLVLDTNTGADLTICEEGTELLHRIQAKLKNKKREDVNKKLGEGEPGPDPLPLFTSCCPGWLAFVEKSAPELTSYISSCKSPHMMYGALMKHFSEKLVGESPDKVYFTSIMPCVRKRGESDHPCFAHEGIREVDNVVTTRDIGQLFRMQHIDPGELEPEPFDSPFQVDGEGTGAGQLFGATGGVMEAAVRTVYELVTGTEMPKLELDEVRGLEGVKEATIPIHSEEMCGDVEPLVLKVAVANGLGNAKKLIKMMKDGEVQYDFVEVMACPGGCIGGKLTASGRKMVCFTTKNQANSFLGLFSQVADNPRETRTPLRSGWRQSTI
jgi:NADH-quinone oxidoreductase subunit G